MVAYVNELAELVVACNRDALDLLFGYHSLPIVAPELLFDEHTFLVLLPFRLLADFDQTVRRCDHDTGLNLSDIDLDFL